MLGTVVGLTGPVSPDDGQLWLVGRVDHQLTKRTARQLLARFRFDDDISQSKDFMLRAFLHGELGPFDVGIGYDYLYSFVNASTSENRLFQLAEHRWEPEVLRGLAVKNRFRIDERFLADVDGVVLRLRYRLQLVRRLGSSWYVSLSDEVFANVIDRGSGPPDGFEQNRLRLLFGRRIVSGVRTELGYEWQLAAQRGAPDVDRHVLLLHVFAAPSDYRAGRGD